MAEIGFIQLPDAHEPIPYVRELAGIPLTAERSSDGIKRAALVEAGFDFVTLQYRFVDRDGSKAIGWLIDGKIASKAVQILENHGHKLLAIQVKRAVEEAEKT